MKHEPRSHVVYAVHFDDKRIKVGVTSNIKKRMSYYAQEARRNHVDGLTWWACKPLPKWIAYLIERRFCRANQDIAMPKHREWFDDVSYDSVLDALVSMRTRCADVLDELADDVRFGGSFGRINS